MTQYAYLHKVESGQNNNKFYIMSENGDGTFTATYGREGAAKPAIKIYSMSLWDKKYYEKLSSKKGYTDVTEFRAVKKIINEAKSGVISNDTVVTKLIELLQMFAKMSTAANYKVEAKDVTQAQIDAAQKTIDNLSNSLTRHYSKNWDISFFNRELERLFTIIPKKMKKVADHLITNYTTKSEIETLIQEEQDRLDAMASQVTTQNAGISNVENNNANDIQDKTLLEQLGLEISLVTDQKVIKEVKSLAQQHASRIKAIYAVTNNNTQKAFDAHIAQANNKETRLLWHGSRVANWFSILQKGLKTRPSGAITTGSMFGFGIYAATESDKSMGYTDSGRWVSNGQNVNSVFMALYDFHIGNPKIITRHDSSCYNLHSSIKNSKVYDSVWAKKGVSLYRDEIIIYNDNQCTIKYLIEFRN